MQEPAAPPRRRDILSFGVRFGMLDGGTRRVETER